MECNSISPKASTVTTGTINVLDSMFEMLGRSKYDKAIKSIYELELPKGYFIDSIAYSGGDMCFDNHGELCYINNIGFYERFKYKATLNHHDIYKSEVIYTFN